MKKKGLTLLVFFSLMMTSTFSNALYRHEGGKQDPSEQQHQVAELVQSKTFVFIAQFAQPTGGRSINLSANPNFVKFHPDLIEGDLPFFGRAYSGVGYGGNAGIQFKGEPEDYTITENKKNFMVKAVVKGKGDVYRLNLRIGLEGSANLTITSNNRSAISYTGDISRPEKP